MGPPTISAEQPRNLPSPSRRLWSFNGAADDLGGTTQQQGANFILVQRFNGAADDLGGTTQSIRHLFGIWQCFNGAADDLGGTTRCWNEFVNE